MPETRYYEVYNPDGTLHSRTPYVVSDAELEREQAPARLRQAMKSLTTIATQADAMSRQGGNLTQTQLKQLAGYVAEEARLLRALLVREFDEPES